MATVTFQYASFNDGQVIVEYDINDANWRVSKIRCINNSPHSAVGHIYQAGDLVFTANAPANQTTSWNVQGVQLAWQPPYWNDLIGDWEEAGIEMGDYELQAAWPWES